MGAPEETRRHAILEPLYKAARERARHDGYSNGRIDDRITYCINLFSSKGAIPCQPREIASLFMDFAAKMGSLSSIIYHVTAWEVNTWEGVENLARKIIKIDAEQGIRCIEMATLYQVRYWTRSFKRFHGTPEEQNEYVSSVSSLLGKLNLLNIEFDQFDTWYL